MFKVPAVELNDEDRVELERRARSQTLPVRVVNTRYNSRERHPVHQVAVVSEERLRQMGPIAPLPLNGRTIRVDTTTSVDIDALARAVVEALP